MSMNRRLIVAITVLGAVALLAAAGWMRTPRESQAVKRTQVALGTFVEIEVRGKEPGEANQAINAAFQEVQRINRDFSPFNESGILWRVNHEKAETVSINRELHDLLLVCDSIYRNTEGAFDPAMEALFQTWRIWGKSIAVPAEEDVQSARRLSGWHRIGLNGSLELTRQPGVQISFGAIAKGYAVDRMTEKLKEHGIDNALVNAGGEIRTLGDGWTVGIQHPSIREELVQRVALPGMAVATSGDYVQHHDEKGKRYHHILDPATGYPTTLCRSVTIIAPTCIEADAYATGVFVLGPERGMELVNRTPRMEAMIIDRSEKILYSHNFNDYLRRRP